MAELYGDLVVVGASLSGLRAAESARREGFAGSIVLIGDERHLPYDRPPLSKQYLEAAAAADHFRTEVEIREELGVDLRLSTRAEHLDRAARVITTDSGDTIGYGRLIVATGATPRRLPSLDGLEGVHVLRTLDDAERLRGALTPASRVVVLGAGFIGSEIASSARGLGAGVTIVEAAPVPLVRAVGAEVGALLADLHDANGTRLLRGVAVTGVQADEGFLTLTLDTGEEIAADLVVVGIGAVPATGWLQDSGLELSPRDGGLICDAFLRTSDEDVYAAGDVVHWPNPTLGVTMRLENWTSAADQGEHAARNALFPEQARPFETVPYFWSDWYGNRIQFVGTAESDEVVIIPTRDDEVHFVALFRTGDRIVGAATLNERKLVMRLRRQIAERASWSDALETVTGATAVAR